MYKRLLLLLVILAPLDAWLSSWLSVARSELASAPVLSFSRLARRSRAFSVKLEAQIQLVSQWSMGQDSDTDWPLT